MGGFEEGEGEGEERLRGGERREECTCLLVVYLTLFEVDVCVCMCVYSKRECPYICAKGEGCYGGESKYFFGARIRTEYMYIRACVAKINIKSKRKMRNGRWEIHSPVICQKRKRKYKYSKTQKEKTYQTLKYHIPPSPPSNTKPPPN